MFVAAFGYRVGIDGLVVAFGLANVLAAIPITPGGLGVVEAVLTSALVGFGTPRGTAVLGVVVYRLVNFWLPIPIGGLAYLSLKVGPARSTGGTGDGVAAGGGGLHLGRSRPEGVGRGQGHPPAPGRLELLAGVALTHPRPRNDPGVLAAVAVGGALARPPATGWPNSSTPVRGRSPGRRSGPTSAAASSSAWSVVVVRRFPSDRYLRPFVATGFLGAYTTYSTFVVEAVVLARDGDVALACAYAAASLAAGLATAAAGIAIGRRAVPR